MNEKLEEKRYFLHLNLSELGFILLGLKTCHDWYKDSEGNKHLAKAMMELHEEIKVLKEK